MLCDLRSKIVKHFFGCAQSPVCGPTRNRAKLAIVGEPRENFADNEKTMTQFNDYQLRRKKTLICFFLMITSSMIFSYIFWKRTILNNTGDLYVHIKHAKNIRSVIDTSPHFLYELLIKILSSITTISLELSSSIVLGACYGIMAVAIFTEINRRSPSGNLLLTACCCFFSLIASHIFLFTLFVPNFYYGYFVPTAYHNPTQQLNKLFALLIWFVYCRHFLSAPSVKGPTIILMAVLCILSAIAKPSFLIVFFTIVGRNICVGCFQRTT